ncbi:MAG TPA: HEPN domain-containing protein [Candidatus Nanoarchaeia archaeon]|nr:HEPN domain-containing protein [Candidatus Nanoarchaeia archaeon]
MDKIEWCVRKKGGISLIEPSTNIAEAYLKKAEDALEAMRTNKIRDWKISAAYYTMYFSLYAVLAKMGIKCEIHACTFEFASRFLQGYITKEEIKFLKESLQARIDAQYYVNRNVPDLIYSKMIKQTPEMIVKCKNILLHITEQQINDIRKVLSSIENRKP